jgi:aspartyl-tRNA synthetase
MNKEGLGGWKKTHFTSEIVPALDGKEVSLMGWLRELRLHGNIAFAILADREGTVQVTFVKKNDPDLFGKLPNLNREDAIAVKGKVKKTDQTVRGVEIIPNGFKVLNQSETPLPLEVTGKTPAELDTRLDARILDLRKPEIAAIFKIRSQILSSARNYFEKQGFIEIETPKIIATATEGGAALFPVSYFETEAFLRQSPQIFKELMTACFEKVYEIGPVFRAEPSDTTRHLAEVVQMDIEMGFATEEETWPILEGVYSQIFKDVKEKCASELKLLNREIKAPKTPFPRKTYSEVIEMLAKKGLNLKWGDDIPPEGEKLITENFKGPVIVYDYPMEQKPYYIHPHEDDSKISHGFDLIAEEIEIASGGRRIHDPELYVKMLKEKGLNPKNFEDIIKFFRWGMPPHAGWAIGVDRLTMVICGLNNVREAVLFPRDLKRLNP